MDPIAPMLETTLARRRPWFLIFAASLTALGAVEVAYHQGVLAGRLTTARAYWRAAEAPCSVDVTDGVDR